MPLEGQSYKKQAAQLPAPALFGTKMRTALLMLIAVLEETYPATRTLPCIEHLIQSANAR